MRNLETARVTGVIMKVVITANLGDITSPHT